MWDALKSKTILPLISETQKEYFREEDSTTCSAKEGERGGTTWSVWSIKQKYNIHFKLRACLDGLNYCGASAGAGGNVPFWSAK